MTDHLMPGMTGVELALAVRARWPAVKLLVVSGFADVEGLDPTLPRLNKPFVQSELAAALACHKTAPHPPHASERLEARPQAGRPPAPEMLT